MQQVVFADGSLIATTINDKFGTMGTSMEGSSAYGVNLSIAFDDANHYLLNGGALAKRNLFAHTPPFNFAVNFASAKPELKWHGGNLRTSSLYTNPTSKWFNVFFGYYELASNTSAGWDRPIGYESDQKTLKPDDMVRVAKADWNYISNYMYGVPESAIAGKGLNNVEYASASNPDGIKVLYHGREKIGEKYWDKIEVQNVDAVSAYRPWFEPAQWEKHPYEYTEWYWDDVAHTHYKWEPVTRNIPWLHWQKTGSTTIKLGGYLSCGPWWSCHWVDNYHTYDNWGFVEGTKAVTTWEFVAHHATIHCGDILWPHQNIYSRPAYWWFDYFVFKPKLLDTVLERGVVSGAWPLLWQSLFGDAWPIDGFDTPFFPVKMDGIFYMYNKTKDQTTNTQFRTFVFGGSGNHMVSKPEREAFIEDQLAATRNRILNTFSDLGYDTDLGDVTTNITPSEAAAAGAQWRIVGESDWHTSDETVSHPAGEYSIEYKELSGWETPAPKAFTLTAELNNAVNGAYSYNGLLEAILTPQQAVAAGAAWRLASGSDTEWHQSTDQLKDIPFGDYTVEFKDILGYVTPASQTVTFTDTTSIFAEYISIQDPELAAEFLFNGDVADSGPNAIVAQLNGASLTNDRNGNSNAAYDFDGVDDYIELDATVRPDFPFSFSGWVRVDQHQAVNNNPVIATDYWNQWMGSYAGFSIRINSAGIIRASIGSGGFALKMFEAAETTLALNTWYHLSVTFNSMNEVEIYVNGVDQNETVLLDRGGALGFRNSNVRIGSEYDSKGRVVFNGAIDDVQLYNKILSPDEVRALSEQ